MDGIGWRHWWHWYIRRRIVQCLCYWRRQTLHHCLHPTLDCPMSLVCDAGPSTVVCSKLINYCYFIQFLTIYIYNIHTVHIEVPVVEALVGSWTILCPGHRCRTVRRWMVQGLRSRTVLCLGHRRQIVWCVTSRTVLSQSVRDGALLSHPAPSETWLALCWLVSPSGPYITAVVRTGNPVWSSPRLFEGLTRWE